MNNILINTIVTIRDLLNYNKHKLMVGDVLNRVEKELSIIENKKENYSEEDYDKFHVDLLNLNMALFPTTNKIIKQIEINNNKEKYEKNICKHLEDIKRISEKGLLETDDISLISDCLKYVFLVYEERNIES